MNYIVIRFFIFFLIIFSFSWSFAFASGKVIDMDLIIGGSPKLKNKFNIDINERKVISGDIHIYPLLKPVVKNGYLSPASVEWYNVLTTWVSFCSLVTRLTLERLTGKASDSLRSGDIPKWDAVSLISIWKREGKLRSIGLFSGGTSIYELEKEFYKLTRASKNSIRDVYLYHPWSYGLNKGHRFVVFRWSDNQIYIIDPILWEISSKAKNRDSYFQSIIEIKNWSQLYLGRWYKPKKS